MAMASAASAAQEGVDQLAMDGVPPTTPILSSRPRAEDMYEILCNDVVLPLDMSLATVRQFIWRQAAELVMHFRKKLPSASRGSM